MSILRAEGVRREIGARAILDSVSASLARGERVGLVGANGAGKTTLLRILAGQEEPDRGSVHRARGLRIGSLHQEANLDREFARAATVLEAVRSGASDILAMEAELRRMETEAGASASAAHLVQSATYAELRERFEARDGYHLDQRVEEALAGLGIPRPGWRRRPTELSGGEQTRAALARLVVANPDVLLLDEPTNHLDVAAIEWLEAALARRAGALVVASHDRAFLDAVAARIWELREGRLRSFRGAYSAYLMQRESLDAREQRTAAALSEAVAHEETLVQRYRSQRKHVKMHEHERRLQRLRAEAEAATPARGDRRLVIPGVQDGRPARSRSGEPVVSLEDVTCGFRSRPGGEADVPVLHVTRLEAARGERIGLVGPNGAGKTTLLRTIAGKAPALRGFVRLGRGVQPAYLSQLRDVPLPGTTVLDAMLAVAPGRTGEARSHLARFLFRGEDVFKPVAELSGGERSRLELALLGIGEADLLLLDEPTNHLDIPAREALEAFLRASGATIVLVSHDRRLLETVCQRLWVAAPGRAGAGEVAAFEGGYRAWRAAVAEGWSVDEALRPAPVHRRRKESPVAPRTAEIGATGGTARAVSAPSEGRRADPPTLSKDAFRREQGRIDEHLARLNARRVALEQALADPDVQSNFVELRRLSSELAEVDGAVAQAEDAWLTLAERAPG